MCPDVKQLHPRKHPLCRDMEYFQRSAEECGQAAMGREGTRMQAQLRRQCSVRTSALERLPLQRLVAQVPFSSNVEQRSAPECAHHQGLALKAISHSSREQTIKGGNVYRMYHFLVHHLPRTRHTRIQTGWARPSLDTSGSCGLAVLWERGGTRCELYEPMQRLDQSSIDNYFIIATRMPLSLKPCGQHEISACRPISVWPDPVQVGSHLVMHPEA